ncbi:MAG: hypothetical protein WC314_26165 [Vulcanimicrobiota bacterium]
MSSSQAWRTLADTFMLDGKPAFHKFEGIRKVVEFGGFDEFREISYLELEVEDEDSITALLARKPVKIVCYDDLLPEQ